ncbi:MAG TPA: GNAT family N-acetyltransferase [Pyrinomonadaceae bacterium]|nr:GNAT family N-acetyltransferase [Pyrinomonadaceae bacterium]
MSEEKQQEAVAGRAVEIEVRECTTVAEFDACVQMQREGFGLPDLELSPRRHMIVSTHAGGWVLGAFAGERLVGFVLHLAATRGDEIIGYSHMMAVAKDHQNGGIGARLKWAQRARALSEGRTYIKWTWDPMQARNAHFNLNRLGVVVRRYALNFYGTDYSNVTGTYGAPLGLDSDRLFAEWELRSPRVESLARGERSEATGTPSATVEIPPDWSALVRADPQAARREQLRVRQEFQAAFDAGLTCAGFERDPAHPRYLLYRE